MATNTIKDKIKKLLALADSSTFDHESHAALQKAQELMAIHKLEMMDLTEEQKKSCIRKKTILSYSTRSSDHYRNDLSSIIADNFCCVNYLSTPRGTRTHYVCFMGMEEDVEIACEVLYAAESAIIRGYNRVYKELCKEYDIDYVPAKYFNPAKIGYIEGYLAGLRQALQSQKDQHQGWGLVLAVPQEAKDFIGGLREVDFGGVTYIDNTFYDSGYTDGKRFSLNKKLDSNKVQEKLI